MQCSNAIYSPGTNPIRCLGDIDRGPYKHSRNNGKIIVKGGDIHATMANVQNTEKDAINIHAKKGVECRPPTCYDEISETFGS